MTSQEQQLLDGLIGRVKNAPQTAKDPEAQREIQNGLGSDPDALYVLCQTVLVQSYALEQAQTQLQQARQQVQALRQQSTGTGDHQPSFLEKIFGSHGSEANRPAGQGGQQVQGQPGQSYGTTVYQGGQPMPPGQPYPPQYPPQGYGYGQPAYGQPGYGYAPGGGAMGGGMMGGGGFGGGGFLQGAMQVAAGVAAGELLTQGLEGMMHGFGHAAGYGSDRDVLGDSHGFADSGSLGDSGSGGDSAFHDAVTQQADSGGGLSPDIEDRRGGSNFLGDTGTGGGYGLADTEGDDSSNVSDDSGSDFDSGNDFDSGDSGFSGDDGGSFDDSNS